MDGGMDGWVEDKARQGGVRIGVRHKRPWDYREGQRQVTDSSNRCIESVAGRIRRSEREKVTRGDRRW